MTRKCAICKETNYRNGSSFFSAPKDPQTRQLWQEAIGIENYVVKDETYVCSKHFYPTDIITHWFSGVPPNVITIKYKKFRLRPGAIPKLHVDPDEVDPQFIECEDEFDINRSLSPDLNNLSSSVSKSYEVYSIPREDDSENIVEDVQFDDQDSQESFEFINDESETHENVNIQSNYNSDEDDLTETLQNQNSKSPLLPDGDNQLNLTPEDNEICLNDEKSFLEDNNVNYTSANTSSEFMLFEDLLEVYTEVNLPKGWNSFVISKPKGHGTTIVYCFMKMNESGMPITEKQVFIKNNMQMRCTVREKNIETVAHNLIKDNSNSIVKTLVDVEELIEEFDKRSVCEGYPITDLKCEEAYRDGTNWRHNSCTLIVNSGTLRCSKCATLGKRKFAFAHTTYSVGKSKLIEKEKRVKMLSEQLEEKIRSSKCEERLSTLPLKTVDLMTQLVDNMSLPEIQKVMIKECFKLESSGEDKVIKFSRTWIFLCLLLYIESPEMYKYMLLNKYMNLPPLFTIRAYLRRVKTDREFYNIFQQSVEGFQPFNEEMKTEQSE
ncbi:uncharacterized protein LOC122502725 [Leptopilina heterotoma]|uniref:uncharacterized protein LOC122502725 n=1 Tax=Leptopilina heterotoma TaxID=63436 RepID=UPI001CA8F8A8|nr:uncharacterized protein LOC122502725 [Leptopilina heterotoma]